MFFGGFPLPRKKRLTRHHQQKDETRTPLKKRGKPPCSQSSSQASGSLACFIGAEMGPYDRYKWGELTPIYINGLIKKDGFHWGDDFTSSYRSYPTPETNSLTVHPLKIGEMYPNLGTFHEIPSPSNPRTLGCQTRC